MRIHTKNELVIQPEEESLQPEETSLSHFCEFVDYYTHHSTDPMYTAAVCEQQAETVRITQQDVNRENIQMLIDTMLVAIDHIEKKWLDEQIQREDLEQVHRGHLTQMHVKFLERKQGKNWITRLYQTGVRRIRKRLGRSKPAPQQEVIAW